MIILIYYILEYKMNHEEYLKTIYRTIVNDYRRRLTPTISANYLYLHHYISRYIFNSYAYIIS